MFWFYGVCKKLVSFYFEKSWGFIYFKCFHEGFLKNISATKTEIININS